MPPYRILPPLGRANHNHRKTPYTRQSKPRSRPQSDSPPRIQSVCPTPKTSPPVTIKTVTHPIALLSHKARIQTVLSHSLAKSTSANYDSAKRAFQDFCTANNFTALPASEFTLVAYVAYLASSMAGSSIANAISGIKSWHTTSNAGWAGSPRLQMALKGAADLTPISSHTPARAPITPIMLEKLAATLDPTCAEDRAILATSLIAFWGQCRLGELLGTSSRIHDPIAFPSRSSLGPPISNNGSRPLHLPRTKTNQLRGESIVITSQPGSIDPIAALLRHLHSDHPIAPDTHLFAFHHTKSNNTKLLTREHFLNRVNCIWSNHGFAKTTGHAFRIGGTTGLLKAGVPPDIVKVMGRWSSDAYFRYWRDTNQITVHHAESVLSRYPNDKPPSVSVTDAHARRLGSHSRPQGSRTHHLRTA